MTRRGAAWRGAAILTGAIAFALFAWAILVEPTFTLPQRLAFWGILVLVAGLILAALVADAD